MAVCQTQAPNLTAVRLAAQGTGGANAGTAGPGEARLWVQEGGHWVAAEEREWQRRLDGHSGRMSSSRASRA